jgi:predicted acyl esterase
MMEEGYIVVYQDVRGRWMSDGLYDMRAYILIKKIKTDVDEASDTYDTIDWLVKIQTITMGMLEFGEFHTRVLCYLFH